MAKLPRTRVEQLLSISRPNDVHWLTIDDLRVRFFFDKITGGLCVMALRQRESALTRTENEPGTYIDFNTVLTEEMKSRINYGSNDILLDLIGKSGRQYSLRYESRVIFEGGLTMDRSVPGFALLLDKV